MKKNKFQKIVSSFFNKNKLFIFIFLLFFIGILVIYRDLFFSYFEADEWFHFTQYFPLTKKPDGLLIAILSPFIHTSALSGGQHVNPVAAVIFFLNTTFFGMNYAPYAFMSLFFHAVNSFLIFFVMKLFLPKNKKYFNFSLLGGVFFALASTPAHTVTGAAPFYGENIFAVTFALLCIIFLKYAYHRKKKKYLFISLLFLFCALFSKETASYLFFLVPVIVLIEKRVFSFTYLGKLFFSCIVLYIFIRFFIPHVPSFFEQTTYQQQQTKIVDTGTIVSRDLSIYDNLPAEVLLRTITFPIRMMGTVFVSRPTVESIAKLMAPIVVPQPSVGDHASQVQFVNSAGNFVVIYLISFGLFLFFIRQTITFIKQKQKEEARLIALGVAIIVLSALPLVAVLFSFPRWGYDSYFDSRHYYNPTIGAALLFPFLFWSIVTATAKVFRGKGVRFISCLLLLLWLWYTLPLLTFNIQYSANRYSADRREFVSQLQQLLPKLPKKIVFYIETDGKSIFGPSLPFYTSVPQAISVVYYNRSPLPNSFYRKPLFGGKPEGYQYHDGQGFGYYSSKKSLADALVAKQFTVDDIYGFYYEAEKGKLDDSTKTLRKDMRTYLVEREKFSDWKLFTATPSATETITFLYPPETEIIDSPSATLSANLLKKFQINNAQMNIRLNIIRVSPTTNVIETTDIFAKIGNEDTLSTTKEFIFDKYHFTDGYVVSAHEMNYYFLKFDDVLVACSIKNTNLLDINILEKILGSFIVEKKQ